MENKNTKELLRIIRNAQSKLAMNVYGMLSDKEIDELYDEILEAEKIILSRTNGI